MLNVIILFILIIFSFSIISIPFVTGQSLDTSFSKYDKNGIQVDFPSNWEKIADTDSQVTFKTMISPHPQIDTDTSHYMTVSLTILQLQPNTKLSNVQSHIINQMIPATFGHNTFLSFGEKDSATSQGDNAHWIEYKIRTKAGFGDEFSAINFFTIRGDKAYVFFFAVAQDSFSLAAGLIPDNYNFYLRNVFQHVLDSFRICDSKQCAVDPNNCDSNQCVTEEWYNKSYRPASYNIFKVIITCAPSSYSCFQITPNIHKVEVLAGPRCDTDPTKCQKFIADSLFVIPHPYPIDSPSGKKFAYWKTSEDNWDLTVLIPFTKEDLRVILQVGDNPNSSWGGSYDLKYIKSSCSQGATCKTDLLVDPKISATINSLQTPGESNPSIPTECQLISRQIQSDTNEKEALQRQLNGLTKGSAETKSELLLQIKDLDTKIAENEKKFKQCMEKNTPVNNPSSSPVDNTSTSTPLGNNTVGPTTTTEPPEPKPSIPTTPGLPILDIPPSTIGRCPEGTQPNEVDACVPIKEQPPSQTTTTSTSDDFPPLDNLGGENIDSNSSNPPFSSSSTSGTDPLGFDIPPSTSLGNEPSQPSEAGSNNDASGLSGLDDNNSLIDPLDAPSSGSSSGTDPLGFDIPPSTSLGNEPSQPSEAGSNNDASGLSGLDDNNSLIDPLDAPSSGSSSGTDPLGFDIPPSTSLGNEPSQPSEAGSNNDASGLSGLDDNNSLIDPLDAPSSGSSSGTDSLGFDIPPSTSLGNEPSQPSEAGSNNDASGLSGLDDNNSLIDPLDAPSSGSSSGTDSLGFDIPPSTSLGNEPSQPSEAGSNNDASGLSGLDDNFLTGDLSSSGSSSSNNTNTSNNVFDYSFGPSTSLESK